MATPTAGHWLVREATREDRPIVAALLTAGHRHQHLDWLSALDLLGRSPFLVSFARGMPAGCLACPPEPPGVAWLRLFSVASGFDPQSLWDALWPHVLRQARELRLRQAAVLLMEKWLEPLLQGSGFARTNAVIFLEWRGGRLPHSSRSADIELRRLDPEELDRVEALDARAFGPIWRHSQATLQEALRQSALATVALLDGELVGYQISTASGFGAHLARLAVEPRFQGRGIGSRLVVDLLQEIQARGFDRVTVNTQEDNLASQRLYDKLGFVATDHRVPVYELSFG